MEACSADALIPQLERLCTGPSAPCRPSASKEEPALGSASSTGQHHPSEGFHLVVAKHSPIARSSSRSSKGGPPPPWWKTPLYDAITQTDYPHGIRAGVFSPRALAQLTIKQLSVALLAASSRGLSEVVAALSAASISKPTDPVKPRKGRRQRAPRFPRPVFNFVTDEGSVGFAAPLKRDGLQYLGKIIRKQKQQKQRWQHKSKRVGKGRKEEGGHHERKCRVAGAGWTQAAAFQDDQRAADGRWAMVGSP